MTKIPATRRAGNREAPDTEVALSEDADSARFIALAAAARAAATAPFLGGMSRDGFWSGFAKLPPHLRVQAEHILHIIAAAGFGDEKARECFTALVETSRSYWPQQSDGYLRWQVTRIVKKHSDAGEALAFLAHACDARFGALTQEQFDAISDLPLAERCAKLTCACGAFGDARPELALNKFESALTNGSKFKRSR
jgi:hypothetical protein